MGRYSLIPFSSPNSTVPIIAPIRPTAAWRPNAVDLQVEAVTILLQYWYHDYSISINLKCTGKYSGVITSRAFHPTVDTPANTHVNITIELEPHDVGTPHITNVLIADSTIETAKEEGRTEREGERKEKERQGELRDQS